MTGLLDAVVLGGGLTGLAQAAALATAGARTVLIERGSLEATTRPAFDGRVTAVALGSKRFLDAIGVWPLISEAEPIRDIVVRERFSPLAVRYDHRDIGSEPLGWIVENRELRRALLARLAALENLTVHEQGEVAMLEQDARSVMIGLKDGRSVRASLLVVAEGKGSSTRQRLGITARRWSYAQTGIVATLRHTVPHRGLAVERFFPDGPFARLPMTGDRSSIVWALRDELAAEITRLDDKAFVGELGERFGDDLGRLRLDGPRWSFPLSLTWADRYAAGRAVLVGDAARAIHPIAGQGWNLAVRDVAAVAELLADRVRLGLDPGDPTVTAAYGAWRRFDGTALVTVTDGLNRLFANDFGPTRLVRELGLGVVDRVRPLKRLFMRHAMGLVGDLPRSMRGLPL